MFRAHTDGNKARGDALQPRSGADDPQEQGWAKRPIAPSDCHADQPVLHQNLHGLCHPHRKLAARLYRIEFVS
jgi:hypothetical protein